MPGFNTYNPTKLPTDINNVYAILTKEKMAAPQAPKTPTFNYKGPSSVGIDPTVKAMQDNWASQMAGYERTIAALNAQMNAAPRLPYYDITAGYSSARQKAEAAVTPYYQKKFAEYAADFNRRRGEANTGAQMGRENMDIELKNLQEGNIIEQGRTAEDVAAALYDVNNQEQQFQQGEGRAFDQQKREMEAKTAASGLATSGLGGQAIQTAQEDRNFASKGQADTFQQERKMKEQFKTRTFEDLMRSDVLGKEKNVQTKKQIDFDLNKMINDLAMDEAQQNDQLRRQQLEETSRQTQDYYQMGVNEFISRLQQQGARAQDIQAAIQTYK